jgi:hypothetical protein
VTWRVIHEWSALALTVAVVVHVVLKPGSRRRDARPPGIPSQLGYKNVKWVALLEVTATRAQGYWEGNGYPAESPVG